MIISLFHWGFFTKEFFSCFLEMIEKMRKNCYHIDESKVR